MKIFIGLIEIAGRYKALKYGFDKIGVPATLGLIHYNGFYSGQWSEHFIIRVFQIIYSLDAKARVLPLWLQYFVRGPIRVLTIIFKLPLFVWAVKNHDVFIFGSFSQFFFGLGYPVLKFFGKKIIFQFHGSDSRPPYLDGRYQEVNSKNIKSCIKLTQKTKKKLMWVEKYADVIVNSPPQGYFHERPYVNRLLVGIPCGPFEHLEDSLKTDKDLKKRNGTDLACKILHAPSDMAFKGTLQIRKIIQSLKAKGLKIDYHEISGVSNSLVVSAIKECDLVVDQLFVDFAMPGLACEAGYFGKPTILAGNSKELWDELLKENERPPTFYCHEEEFESGIEFLIRNPQDRRELGLKAQKFVKTNWSPETVAKNYLKLAEGSYPPEWVVNPNKVPSQIAGGFFKPKIMAQKMVREIMARDKKHLQLDDKPHLLKKLSEFAEESKVTSG